MYSLIKKVLFRFDPEQVHYWVMARLQQLVRTAAGRRFLKKQFCLEDSGLERELWGIRFKNPVGLAAGFDKDARFTDALSHLGFGFIEIGTLTPKPQPGNDKPRLFRLPEDSALINRMGFNNEGVLAAVERLKKRKSNVIVGGNIGKNKVTPNESALDDYAFCFEALYEHVDYFVINVSSPNTPGLRELQEKEPLTKLLQYVVQLSKQKPEYKPIFLKIAPDLTTQQLDDIIEILQSTKTDGIIATNTTISRDGLLTSKDRLLKIGNGGLSGKPLRIKSTEVIRYLRKQLGPDY